MLLTSLSLQAVQFQGRSVESGKVPAAGISGGFIPQHQHTHHVDNTAQAGEVNHDMVTVMQSDYKLVLHSVCVCLQCVVTVCGYRLQCVVTSVWLQVIVAGLSYYTKYCLVTH